MTPSEEQTAVSDLTVQPVTVEHHREPFGIGEAAPRLCWIVATDRPGWQQAAYELQIEPLDGPVWTSGRVATAESVLVPWSAEPLSSRERRVVRVRVWGEGDDEPSAFSDDTVVEAGLLVAADRSPMLVRPVAGEPVDGAAPAALLRREFIVDRPVARARLYATAQGVYEAEINGAVVGDLVLAPGWSSYQHRLRYQTYDVTALLTEGANAVGVHLADGWFRGYLGFGGHRSVYGDATAAWVQLEIEYADGLRTTVVGDEHWRTTLGPLTRADLYNGETFDAARDLPGWSTAGFDDSGWSVATMDTLDPALLVAPPGPPVRRTETVAVQQVLTTPSGATVVDFGQNLVGRIRFRLPAAPAGTVITVRHAEVLEDGELGTRPLRRARATDSIVLDGRGAREWEPRFTFHGFRYAQIDGWPGDLAAADLTAVVLHTDMAPTGTFTCSDPDVSRLHENVRWGMRGNFLDVPTDCPQRDERLGWTGDLAVFAPTATFLYDTAGMLGSWLADLAVEQDQHDGVVPLYVPFPDISPPGFPPLQPEAGWGTRRSWCRGRCSGPTVTATGWPRSGRA